MVVRLAFAVAINVDPEILLVDEALAVGDTYFRHRCMRKVHELRARGVTIVFVSHADRGRESDRRPRAVAGTWPCAMALGEPDTVLAAYLAAMSDKEDRPKYKWRRRDSRSPLPPLSQRVYSIPNVDHRHGDGRAEILGIAILNDYGEAVHLMMPDSRVVIRISLRANENLSRPSAGFLLRNHLGLDFCAVDTDRQGHPLPTLLEDAVYTVDFHLDIPEFYPGAFSFSPFVSDGDSVCDWIDNAITVQMGRGEAPVYGYIQLPCRIEAETEFV